MEYIALNMKSNSKYKTSERKIRNIVQL